MKTMSFIPDGVDWDTAVKRTTHLAIGAHQDDLEIFAYHGIAECYGEQDRWFGGVTITDGAGSARTGPFVDFSDEQMIDARNKEQNQAAEIGKYSFQVQLNLPSRVVKENDPKEALVDLLAGILTSCRPKVLYLHNPADKHLTHIAVLRCCIKALRRMDRADVPEKIYGCEVWRDLDWMRDEDKVPLAVDRYPELARQLIEVFQSQVAGGKSYVEATLGRRVANATFYASHQIDGCGALTFAMDLCPLFREPGLTLEMLVTRHIDHFHKDVSRAYS